MLRHHVPFSICHVLMLVCGQQQKSYMYLLLGMSLLLTPILILAVQHHGMLGAAIATSALFAATNAAVLVLVYRQLERKGSKPD